MKPRLAQLDQSGATTGQVATWDGTKWAPATPSGGGGGGGGSGTFYTARDSSSTSSGTVPVTATLVPTLTITVPSAGSAQTALVSFNVVFDGSHTNRFKIYLDGAQVWPGTGNGVSAFVAGANTVYEATASQVPIDLASGSSHTIEIRYEASESTSAVTFKDRSVIVQII